ncbi:MAG TPA: hypothetical protein VGF34_15015 [Stellaceae bacterium]
MRPILWTVSIWLASGAGATAQTGSAAAFTATIAGVCRGYAAAQTGMPAALAFERCMIERHCRMAASASGWQCPLPAPVAGHGGGL